MERRKREKRDSLTTRVLVYACALGAGSFAVIFAVTTAESISRSVEIRGAQRALQTISPKIQQVKNMKDEEQNLLPRLGLLQSAKQSTTHWYLVYQQTGQGLPGSSWLDSINLASDTQTGTKSIVLAGQSLSEETVADTIQQLQKQPLVEKVELHMVQQPAPTPVAAPNTPGASAAPIAQPLHPVRFEIGVQLRQPQEAKDAKPTV